jgi:outer membrane lipoprotein-sorting protein
MKFGRTTGWACPSIGQTRYLFASGSVFLTVCIAIQQLAGAQMQGVLPEERSPLTAAQVRDKLLEMNLRRAQALHSYQGTRTYRVTYRGLLGLTVAGMVVDVTYKAPDSKEFIIRSSTGSKVILDKVFKKLLQAEKEALSIDGQRRTALNSENYEFTMVGYESIASRRMYVLTVEPKTKSKFLFRGRIWVDANDFAVVRLEAEPAKNPSFWTKSSQIEQSYKKVNDFYLPQRNHSVSSIRIGGRAELTIEYQNYDITGSDRVSPGATQKIAHPSVTTLSQIENGHE